MTKEEKQALHGLYHGCGEVVGRTVKIRSEEIIWLLNTRIPATRNWRQPNGGFQWMEADCEGDYRSELAAGRRRAERPLSHLSHSGFIQCTDRDGLFEIALTAKGAQVARELNSRFGRANHFYKEHKDGILGILLVILISVVTTLTTNFLTSSGTSKESPNFESESSARATSK